MNNNLNESAKYKICNKNNKTARNYKQQKENMYFVKLLFKNEINYNKIKSNLNMSALSVINIKQIIKAILIT